MATRIALIAAVIAIGALAIWRPASRPPVDSIATESATPDFTEHAYDRHHRDLPREPENRELMVYVAGAVKKPGLYHLRSGDRAAQAVAMAGGFGDSADAAGINLAQRADDGDEIYVPTVGEALRPHLRQHRTRSRHSMRQPPTGSVDVNRAAASELASVPGIGRALGARIVELREREGAFASLDELLDIAGMTQTRLERARPYLREP